ncbi:MAG: SurA N-terminal domain-containing protein [Litoreibacter sp.]
MSYDDAPRRKKSSASNIFVWIILVLLIGGLAGFGIGGFGNSITSVGSVGKTEITIQQYQNALQQELAFESRLRGQPVSAVQARELGIDQRVLRSLSATAALSEETRVMGLSVGDAEVRRELQQVQAFQGVNGQFDREAYEFTLQQSNIRPATFEEELRLGAARGLLQQAIAGGVTVNNTYGETLYKFLSEQRSFRWAPVSSDLLVGENAVPEAADLETFHSENSDQFLTPLVRKITYAWLTPEMMLSEIDVSDDRLRQLYDERGDQYNKPARRLIERLSFPDTDTAAAAKASVESGETTFEELVVERNLSLEDVDQGEVSRDDLNAEIGDAVFGLTELGLTDPIETSLGPALYRVNAILEPTSVPFEDAREELLNEVASDEARRAIGDLTVEIDDLLVGGATLEDLAKETQAQIGQIDLTSDTVEGIAGYTNFRSEAFAATTDDFPEIKGLSDGGIFALRLDEIIEPALPALADIREDVLTAWNTSETNRRLAEMGDDLLEQLKSGTTMEALDLSPVSAADLNRSDRIEGAPLNLLIEVFKLETGDKALVQSGALTALVELQNIQPADLTTTEAENFLQSLNGQAGQAMAADVFEAFGQSIQGNHGLSLNQAALNALASGQAGHY